MTVSASGCDELNGARARALLSNHFHSRTGDLARRAVLVCKDNIRFKVHVPVSRSGKGEVREGGECDLERGVCGNSASGLV